MRNVSKEEAEHTLSNLIRWVKSETNSLHNGNLGEWIYTYKTNPRKLLNETETAQESLIDSLTEHAKQFNWKTPSSFPLCPSDISTNPLNDYYQRLQKGFVFSNNRYGNDVVVDYAWSKNDNSILILTKDSQKFAIKPYGLVEVFWENDSYIHQSNGKFFKEDGAMKQFVLAQGKEWLGGTTFDELC